MRARLILSLRIASAMPLILAAYPAFAQTAPSSDAERDPNEIVVTAQRREQSVIEVPAAITALSGEKLQTLGVSNLPDVARQVPNFNVNYERGKNSTPNFSMRGVRGDGLPARFNESSIAVYTDDVFMSDETLINTLLFDIGRVEILRGPQGTVFGKNTTGGLVHFISAKPTKELSGFGSFQYGSDNQTVIEGAVSGPLSDRIRVRLAGRWDRDDGHFVNDYLGAGSNGIPKHAGDTNVWGVRGIVDIDLSERTLLRLIGNYGENNSQPSPGRTFGALLPETTKADVAAGVKLTNICSMARILDGECVSLHQVQLGAAPVLGRNPGHGITNLTDDELFISGVIRSGTAMLTHEMDWATLTSVTDYRSGRYAIQFDGDAGLTPSIGVGYDFVAQNNNHSHQFSQEFRLNGDSDAISWVGGLYYESDHKESAQSVDFRTFGAFFPFKLSFFQQSDGAVNTRAYAMFGQIDAHISPTVTLSMGGRYSGERRELTKADTFQINVSPAPSTPPVQNILAAVPQTSVNNKNFTGKFSVAWQPDADSNYYATYSRGLKGAGFSTGYSPSNTLAVNVASTGPVGQEVLDAFEVGIKKRFLDRRLSINSAAFFYDFNGKQENLVTFNGISSSFNYINVGEAHIYGVETEINFAPDRHWDLTLSGGWLHSEVVKSDIRIFSALRNLAVPVKGKELAQTPNWNFNAILAYHIPTDRLGEFSLQTEVRGQAKQFYSITNDPLGVEEGHVFANLRVLWESADKRYNAQVFVTNLFEEREASRLTAVSPTTGSINTHEGEGRLWGVKAGVNF